jgi:O-acetyl-ADP-ribose deacetylase (regulator of RNase III)
MATIYKYENSDLTNSRAEIICHQVNCQGKMASGVAKAIREKWSIVYDKYMDICNNRQQSLGYAQFISLSDYYHNSNQYVVNMFAQDRYGYDGFKYTNYEAFYQCLTKIKKFVNEHETVKTIAFPYRIGCDRGGANWNIILTMIYEMFKDTDLNIEIVSLGEIKE